jgi:hypothetical protein
MHVYDHFGIVFMHSESWHVLTCGSNGLSRESKWIGKINKLKDYKKLLSQIFKCSISSISTNKALWHTVLVGSITDYFVASVYKKNCETLGKKCFSYNLSRLLKLIKNNDWDSWAKIILFLPSCYDQHPVFMPKIKSR